MGSDLRTIIEGILEGKEDIAFKTSAILNAIYDAEEQKGRRDMFAAMAMQGLISKLPVVDFKGQYGEALAAQECDNFKKDVAESARGYAYALIAELDKKDKSE